jgi:MFS family permease
LGEAVSLHNMGANIMRTVGPTLGGFLITFTSATATFIVGGLSYLPALLMLLLWKPPAAPVETARESVTGAMESGIRFLAASPHLQPILVRVFCFSTSAISIMALLPLVVRDQIGGDATEYGAMFGAFGLGAILGGFVLRHFRTRRTAEWVVQRAFLTNAGAILALAASHNLASGLAAMVVAGSCWLTVHSLQNTILQLATPRWMVGRMVSMFLTAAFLGLSVGSWFWGFVTEHTSTEIALAISASAMGATYLLALRFPLPDTQNLVLDPLEQEATPLPASEIGLRAGPIQVMLEHDIESDRLNDFYALMQLRRRHLIRLGARQWTLLKEIGNEGKWIETFQFPTWADYQRLMKRRTAETAALRMEVRALQRNGAGPLTRRLVLASPGPKLNTVMLRT